MLSNNGLHLHRCVHSYMLLVSSSHPTLLQGEMNQVKFLGLVHVCDTVTKQHSKYYTPNPLKKGTDTQVEIKKKFTVVKEVLCNNYQSHISLVFTTFGE